ncbi:FAD-dependent oxidoreductase [Rhodococcus sp. T2V]|uniref:oxidoreductase n=1 Tax=Rhodococcus sp. T2V TaxID=3034164 RepID=UPI0023E1D893|nr:FAD-dependent oxidoreductase [Rhodococcus sp. T2V]MDF3309676.1 FAD-dependent oxidoreductase [Rhodococcus sp. T2V]
MSELRRLFEPLRVGGFTVKNRIVCPTHNTGLPRERELTYLARRAEGGAGLIGISGTQGVIQYAVGPGTPGQVGEWDRRPPSPASRNGVAFYDDLVIPRLRERADLLRENGARSFAQVAHGGAAQHWSTISPTLGPSTVPDLYDGQTPHALSEEQIEELVFSFAHGIRRIAEAGIDAAEIHGAHGYLVMQFLSPYTNRRTDQWGGTTENRTRFVRAIMAAARDHVGADFPIGLRLGYDDFGDGRGITVTEAVALARVMAPDLAYLSVSGGSYSGLGDGFTSAYVSPWYRPPAYNAEVAAAVRAAVDVPVLLTGRIADAALADSLIAEGSADLIGMVRALVADPDLPRKAQAGTTTHVRMCLGLSECHHIGRHRVPLTCAVNAASGREDEMRTRPAAHPKTVIVVGAGPAGMEAARIAAIRGHHVYLSDEQRRIGGTPRLLARDPNRRNLLDQAAYFESVLPHLGVEFVLGNRVDVDDIRQFGADAVLIATGSRPLVPDVPGLMEFGVHSVRDILEGVRPTREHVLVVGGPDQSIAAPSIAEFLVDLDYRVTLISELPDFAPGVEDTTRLTLLQRIRRKRVVIRQTTRLERVDENGATMVDTFANERWTQPDISIVAACGAAAEDSLARMLAAIGMTFELVGDALAPRRIMHATIEGARAAMAL